MQRINLTDEEKRELRYTEAREGYVGKQQPEQRPLRPCKGCMENMTRNGWCSDSCFRAEDGEPEDW